MKPRGESREIFEAYAEIDYYYWVIKQTLKALENNLISSEEVKKDVTNLIEKVIENKKIVKADYTADEKDLEQLKNLK